VRKFIAVCLLPFVAGCLTAGYRSEVYPAAKPSVQCPAGVVFVANGSGDFHTVSNNLGQALAETSVPLEIETFTWSQGYGRYLFDHINHDNHLSQGRLLANQVAAYRQLYPARRIYLVGHSAGCAVILAAAERLPPGSVERIVLLAPSVSQEYDLRPALRTARLGIDVFHSCRDRWILGLCMQIVGTADGHGCSAAGQCGFTPVVVCPEDAPLYSKLRQHPWDPAVEWSGHAGGHYGSNQVGFLKAYVVPLLSGG
jgi:pimeloyl-ACP methyl ester carboxylesterase